MRINKDPLGWQMSGVLQWLAHSATGIVAITLCVVALLGMTGCAQTSADPEGRPTANNNDAVALSIDQENTDEPISVEDGAAEVSEEDAHLIATAREALGVPTDRTIICSVGKEYYWEEGQQYLRSVSFLEDGELCAGADCAQDGTPIRNIVPY